jgi:hypothetical protein
VTNQAPTNHSPGKSLIPVLWFVAAGLACVAVGIRYTRDREPSFALIAGAIFCLIMGIIALRSPQPPSR